MMQPLKLLFVLLASSASVRAFWWSSPSNDPPVASKQVQYVRAFTYQPVAFPAHSLLTPPAPYKFIQASPAAIIPTAKQINPVQPTSQQPVQPVQQQSSSSPFSSFFGSAFGGFGQPGSSNSVLGVDRSNSISSVPSYQQQQQQQQQQMHQQQQQQHQQQLHEVPSGNQGLPPAAAFYQGQQHPSKYPYFTMDQVQYLSGLPSNTPQTPQVQFVPCMCPIAVNVQSNHAELADKRLDETTTTDAEVVVPSGESEK
ncbi:vacuolar protein-sorting-associated protein 36-like [Anopheles arabiensis]|uniref:vacuolar protein-sorting-associated protein 36-like n=1 Tax=Anopheles arabiensis TaxID=7173 RepID=UPI001AADFAEB|nr:vacuolar protein-sorting-associated protein 36-like [Anopheles arabiensis]